MTRTQVQESLYLAVCVPSRLELNRFQFAGGAVSVNRSASVTKLEGLTAEIF